MVRQIPPTKQLLTETVQAIPIQKRRVAGYARVSTETDEQFTSFVSQVEYYTSFIKSHENWKFVKVYCDEGISGTSTKHRAGFKQMIQDAKSGKIDLIITKSVSRFARNTVDTLITLRELKDIGVEVYFEKENIWSFDNKGEVLTTIMASLAQEESRSLSENVKWGIERKYQRGQFSLPYKSMLGYDKGPEGMPVVNEEQAEIVRRIFRQYLSGDSPKAIAQSLDRDNIPTPRNGKRWGISTIVRMLQNEKYTGNAILRKTYTADYLTKRKVVNNGEMAKYHVTGSHEAIISEEEFNLVQDEMRERSSKVHNQYTSSIFSGKVRCGKCGGTFGAKVWHSTDKYRSVIYRCNSKYGKDGTGCGTPHLTENELKVAVVSAMNIFLDNRKTVIANLQRIKKQLFSTDALEKEKTSLEAEVDIARELYRKSISSGPITDTSKPDAIQDRFNSALAKLEETKMEINIRRNKRSAMNRFIKTLEQSGKQIGEFSDELFISLADHVTVFGKFNIVVTFRDGQEIRVEV